MKKTGNKYKYFSLISEIALTDFKLKYQGSFLGYLWSLIKPLAEFTVLYLVFTKVFKIGNAIPHYPIFLLLGVLIFSFWSEATSTSMLSIATRGDLIRKVYFPRIVLVIASTITAFITFLLNSLVILVFAYFNKLSLDFSMLKALTAISFFLSCFLLIKLPPQIWQPFFEK